MNSKRIIGLVGFKGSGKNTVGEYLVVNHGFTAMSFAAAVKNTVAALWGWPRHLLEGDTQESRIWREEQDDYWTNRIGKRITPREQLQFLSTELVKNQIHDDFWLMRLRQQLMENPSSVTITDVRFPNEIKMIQELGGEVWLVQREPMPLYYKQAVWFNRQRKWIQKLSLPFLWRLKGVHESERAWIGTKFDRVLGNNSSLENLFEQVEDFMPQK